MRNFILFIRRFFNLILFLLLEVICVVLIARTNTLQGNDIMSSANVLIAGIYQKQSDVAYYFALKRMNDSLITENAELRRQLSVQYSVDTFYDSTATITTHPQGKPEIVTYADYVYRTARVINNSIGYANNYITINRGEQDGVKKGMAVTSGNGAVGRIVNTSAHFATAISILSTKQQVSARLKDGTIGYVIWNGKRPDELVMKDVPQQIKVRKGDSVMTTAYSFFPPDVLIGTVSKIEVVKSNSLQILHLKPATTFRSLQYVYVVENKKQEERNNLEQTNQYNNK